MTDLGYPEATITHIFTHSDEEVTLFVSGMASKLDGCDDSTLIQLKSGLPDHS